MASLSENELATNLSSQVEEYGKRYVLFDEIVDHRIDGSEVQDEDAIIRSENGGRHRKETTKGWETLSK